MTSYRPSESKRSRLLIRPEALIPLPSRCQLSSLQCQRPQGPSGSYSHGGNPPAASLVRRAWRPVSRVYFVMPNYLFRRKAFGLSPYWPKNAELLPYGSFIARATLRGKLFSSSFFPQLLPVGLVSTAAHSLRTDGRLVPKGQTGNSPMLQHW